MCENAQKFHKRINNSAEEVAGILKGLFSYIKETSDGCDNKKSIITPLLLTICEQLYTLNRVNCAIGTGDFSVLGEVAVSLEDMIEKVNESPMMN